MRNTKLIIILVLSFIAVYGIASVFKVNLSESNTTVSKTVVIINGQAIYVDIADTPALRERGLSGRGSLKDNEGMLFIFDSPEKPGFWMKEMLFPIDIIWIGADKQIVDVSENLSPSSYPHIFSPKTEIKYVLEVPSGFVKKNKVEVGAKIVVGWQ